MPDKPTPAAPRPTTGPLLFGDRPLPHDPDAEMAVLGSMLLDPKDAIPTAAAKLSFPNSFFNPAHQTIFNTLAKLRDTKIGDCIDLLATANALKSEGALEKVGDRAYLAHLMSMVPSAANVELYAQIVYDHALLRRLIQTGADIAARAFDPQEDVRVLIDQVEAEIMTLTRLGDSSDMAPVKKYITAAITQIEKTLSDDPDAGGLKTGFGKFDEMTNGLKPGDMVVLAARPSIGKTALALNVAANVALGPEGQAVGVFSLEMSAEQLVMRLLCSIARISQGELRNSKLAGSRWEDLVAAADKLKKSRLFIDDTGGIDILALREKARRLKHKHGLDLLIIDYLQLIRPVGGNRNASRENDVSQISGNIKSLAKELGIPIIILAQLNRQAELSGQKPKLSHLRESGAIEQDADIVLLLHRNRDTDANVDPSKDTREAELIFAKHRNGETGIIPLVFTPKHTRFEVASRIADSDVPRDRDL
ncbi:MAG: replicative DNA helicase [Lentisphaeria bacterium]|jgi:replicative DNA helicase